MLAKGTILSKLNLLKPKKQPQSRAYNYFSFFLRIIHFYAFQYTKSQPGAKAGGRSADLSSINSGWSRDGQDQDTYEQNCLFNRKRDTARADLRYNFHQ